MSNKDITLKDYTVGEERFNWITHLSGFLLAVAATVLIILRAARGGGAFGIASAAVYGASMMILYAGSTIYHALPRGGAKKRARVIDHCSIFILIAGTYTPYALITLREALPWLGWTVFGIVWGGGLLGIILNLIDLKRFSKLSMACYITFGWCGVASGYWLFTNLEIWGIVLLLAGGVFYTVGAVFYAMGKKRKYIHSVWHLFVLAGTVAQFFGIYFYVFIYFYFLA